MVCCIHARFHGRRHLWPLRSVPEHMSGFCSESGTSETHHRHVFAWKQGTGFSLFDNEEFHFFALSHDILLQAWLHAMAFIPLGSHMCSSTRPSFIHSVYRASTRVLGTGDRCKGHSQSSRDGEGVTERTQWSVRLDYVRRWGDKHDRVWWQENKKSSVD